MNEEEAVSVGNLQDNVAHACRQDPVPLLLLSNPSGNLVAGDVASVLYHIKPEKSSVCHGRLPRVYECE